jgi:hypothetical protein
MNGIYDYKPSRGVDIFAMFWHSDSVIVERIVPILPLLFQMKAHKG